MAQVSASEGTVRDEHGYDVWLQQIQNRFLVAVTAGKQALFTTDAGDLFAAYLDALPPEHRQYYTCHACRDFLRHYGGLKIIDEEGITHSALWDEEDAPPFYQEAARCMGRLVRRASITGIFLTSESVWGKPVTGIWHHFSVTPPVSMVYRRVVQTAGQAMAEKREDFRTLVTSMQEFSLDVVRLAVAVLKAEAVYRSEKCLGVAEWLQDLHTARSAVKGEARKNLLWLAVAKAPVGFCHVRSSMIGTLLEDIAAGLPFADVKTRFDAKMHPLRYQRPQAAPTVSNIQQAEKLVEQMGITASLRRRFARLDEVQALWRPVVLEPEPQSAGVFAHLRPKETQPPQRLVIPPTTMTWEKFRREILPAAEQIDYFVPTGLGNFTALVTAVDPTAPPILQWDREEQRNPVSWYVWNGGSPPSQWGLSGGQYCPVSAVTLKPSMWHDEAHFTHQGQAVIFILEGAKETKFNSLALFPETLKAELHAVRATIEAYSHAGKIEGAEEASACGIMLQHGGNWEARIRVTVKGATSEYRLDRWD